MDKFTIVIKANKGLDEVLEKEIKSLVSSDLKYINRGFTLNVNNEEMYRLNYLLRTATSILKPIESFTIKSVDDLYNKCLNIPWEKYFDYRKTFSIDHTIHSDLVNHTQYAALKVKDAIADRFRNTQGKRPNVERYKPDFVINVHITGNQCTLSFNSSGDPLFKRGYKKDIGLASLKENLAAGMILLSDWDRKSPLIDPFCGSGTIVTEAAMIAMNIPAGYFRDFSFQNWKDFEKDTWKKIKDEEDAKIIDNPTTILGFDLSKDAITSTSKNLELFRGMRHGIKVKTKNFFDLTKPFDEGTIISNLPYDIRLKHDDITGFYKEIGTHLKHNFSGYNAWIISSNKEALKSFGLKYSKKYILLNSKLECEYLKFSLYDGSLKDKK